MNSARNAQAEAEDAIERLATGSRVNRAGNDSAGLAIAQRHTAAILGLAQAAKNSADTQNILATADSGLSGVSDALIRINQLAVSAQNSTLAQSEKSIIQAEIEQLLAAIDSNSSQIYFNRKGVLNGNIKNSTALVGAQASGDLTYSIPEVSTSTLGAYIFYANGTAASAAAASAANNSVTTAEDLTIKGSLGTYVFDAINKESADNLASRINAQSELTGVLASAKTEALLSSTGTADALCRLLINGAVTDRFNFSSTNFGEATRAINAISGTTGVSAEVANGGIRLKNTKGEDVVIENMESTTNLRVRKFSADGTSFVGSEVALQASGNNDATRVTGTLMLSSSESFGIHEAGATGSESIVVETDTSISQTFGDVSIVNGFIYLGTGDSAEAIGSVDQTQNGQNGQPLKINLGQFSNNDFETGSAGDTAVSGWSLSNSQIKLNGASSLAGQPTATDTAFPPTVAAGYAAPYDQMTPGSATYQTELST